MKFRTEYIARKVSFSLNVECPVVLAGSCFSQNMAAKMEGCLWNASNPSGTLYNPLSISIALDMMLDYETGIERFCNSLFLYNGIWQSDKFDSSFSSPTREDCIREFEIRQQIFKDKLTAGRQLIITFGTSYVYYLTESRQPVGNCHKLPEEYYFRERMEVTDILNVWNDTIECLQRKIPGINIIFTVSPVRHLKDGFTGNARSKAILILAIEEILKNNKDCHYFPAFEILNDDLRDYRFYASDLAHPSEEAVEYIWSKFLETYIDKEGLQKLEEGGKKFRASNHRPKLGALGKPLTGFPKITPIK